MRDITNTAREAQIFSAAPDPAAASDLPRPGGGARPERRDVRRVLVDSGAQAHTFNGKYALTNGARPTGEFGRPTHLVDGGGVRPAITACGEYVGCLAGTTDVVQISDVCYSPSFQADVLSVGVLRRSGRLTYVREPGAAASRRRRRRCCASGSS